METVELTCETRLAGRKGLIRKLRREGRVPAIIYGNKGEPTAVAIATADLQHRGSSTTGQRLIRLSSSSSDFESKHVVVKEIQRAPVSGDIIHVDFYEVDLNKPLRVSVPLRFIGRAKGIIDGGILQPLEREMEVECLPLDIPEAVQVDVSELGIHDVLHVSSLKFEGNVKPIFDTDFPVVTVLPPTVAEVPVAAAAAEAVVAEGAPAEGAAPAAGAAPAPAAGGKEEAAAKKS